MDLYHQWIEALDSYKPTCGKLRNESNQFCCLGVLCDISNIGGWVDVGNHKFSYVDGDGSMTALPTSVQNIVKLRNSYGGFDFNELSTSLQNEILKYVGQTFINKKNNAALTTINDEMLRHDVNPFPIIKQILIERPPSLFVEQNQT